MRMTIMDRVRRRRDIQLRLQRHRRRRNRRGSVLRIDQTAIPRHPQRSLLTERWLLWRRRPLQNGLSVAVLEEAVLMAMLMHSRSMLLLLLLWRWTLLMLLLSSTLNAVQRESVRRRSGRRRRRCAAMYGLCRVHRLRSVH